MKKKHKKFIFNLIVLFLLATAPFLFGQTQEKTLIPLAQLIAGANNYDGQEVWARGEAIGDLMKRADGTWLNITDDNLALGIFFKKEVKLPPIKFLGDYQTRGDEILVFGVFHKNCRDHGGETDLHVKSAKIIQIGSRVSHPINPEKIFLNVVLLIGTIALVFLAWLNKRTQKKPQE